MNKVEANMHRLIPLVTEKALKVSEANRVVFKGPKDLTKDLSKQILNLIYSGNKVVDITSVLIKGKTKKFRRTVGKRKDYKKFYVKFEKAIDITTEVK